MGGAELAFAAVFALAPFTPSVSYASAPQCAGVSVDGVPLALCDGIAVQYPRCAYEDGNPDGAPCVWVDPDTGNVFYNDGGNYRD
jgi:hypothetical protein